MAEAMEQAVETVEPDIKEPPSNLDGEAGVVPKPAAEITPETDGISLNFSETQKPSAPRDAEQHPPSILKGRYLISPAQPLPVFNSPTAPAYAVEDRRETGRKLFALICNPGLPPSTETMEKLRHRNVNGMIPIIDFGPTFWSPLGQKCMVLIMQKPLGGRLIDSFDKAPIRINEYEITRHVLEPIILALRKLTDSSIAHRAIRVDNLYYMDVEHHELVLGECVTTPPGHDQPIVYEPLERAMAAPSGRGLGSPEDDLYALGILAVFLLIGKNPVAKLSDEEMLAGKSEAGTYQFICGHERIPLPLIEVLRGVLADIPSERWTLKHLVRWIDGQKPTPPQRKALVKASVPFKFSGREFSSARTIGYAFSKNIAEAAKSFKSGKLEQWLRKSMNNAELADAVAALATLAKVHENKPDGDNDVIVSKVCMRLDPVAPIRFKGLAFMPDGFGSLMAVEYLRKGSFQVTAEVLNFDLVNYWIGAQSEQIPETMTLDKTFQTLRSFAKLNDTGYGMERCLYELNKTIPCQGEFLNQEYISNIDQLLPTLNEISDKVDKHARPMDRHIAAYIATHFNYDIQPHLKALCSPVEEVSLIGLLSLYALIQWRLKHENLFGLSSWIGGLLQPAIRTYHSRTTQTSIEQDIPAHVRQGSLPDLFDLIDNSDRRHSDQLAFKQAQLEFSIAEKEIQSVVGEGIDQEKVALESGERATAMFSIILSMIGITVVIFIMAI